MNMFRVLIAVVLAQLMFAACGSEEKNYSGAGCAAASNEMLADELWAKVASQSCVECHKPDGDAEKSKFVLHEPGREQGDAALKHNRQALIEIAKLKEGDQPLMLLKASGKVKHGGKTVLKPDSAGYRVLADFVKSVNGPAAAKAPPPLIEDKNAPPFFAGVKMVDERTLLRRVTLSLAGRLPKKEELTKAESGGAKALPELLDGVMTEDAFFDRLREAFNDIFLTIGYDDVPENALSYDHFSTTRGWAEKFDLSKITEEKARQQARYKLSGDYRKAMLGEPMKLIEYIVRNDHPFSEIITADYIMVTPYTSRGYGIYETLKPQFKNPDDPFEYVPVKLKALIGREKSQNQESATGFYPHAGILSTFQYMKRYPTTETNRNRLRARMYFLQFLGIDVLELAARVQDAAAVTAKYKVPTMEASECVVCHKTIDPVAGLFQDYWKFDGVYGRRKGGWFTDMFGAGFEGENLPEQERWRALQWLGERTVKDPRFAVAMVEHAYYVLTGRKVLLPPKDLDDPLFNAKRRAYSEQRKQTETIAKKFAENNFNFKGVLKDWILSDFYRVDAQAAIAGDPARKAELGDMGVVRMLAPEQLNRKIDAIFGKPWNQLKDEQIVMLYGGIDSKEVTERAADPSGAMGAIQRIMSNEIACKNTALDFSRKAEERRLFADMEPDVTPATSPEADAKIRKTIVHLHERILGRYDKEDSPEVERTFKLFAGVVADASKKKFDKEENWSCRQGLEHPVPDPKYTVRAWRAVGTYLLRQQEFLYE